MNTNHAEAPSTTAACAMVIFGATGDLTKRKLLPALLNLAQENVLPQHFAIIGVAGMNAQAERVGIPAQSPMMSLRSIGTPSNGAAPTLRSRAEASARS